MVKMTCFRFNLDNPEHAKAWEYLHSIDKDKVKSGNTAVVRAVNDYFDRMQNRKTKHRSNLTDQKTKVDARTSKGD